MFLFYYKPTKTYKNSPLNVPLPKEWEMFWKDKHPLPRNEERNRVPALRSHPGEETKMSNNRQTSEADTLRQGYASIAPWAQRKTASPQIGRSVALCNLLLPSHARKPNNKNILYKLPVGLVASLNASCASSWEVSSIKEQSMREWESEQGALEETIGWTLSRSLKSLVRV